MSEEAVDRYNGALDGMVSAWTMPFTAEFCSPQLLEATHAIAESRNTRTTLHYNNGARWIQRCADDHGCSPTEYLDRLGALTPRMTLSHCLGISEDEARLISERDAAVAMCPTAAVKGGAGMTQSALLPELLEYGARVGLGTDAGNNSNLWRPFVPCTWRLSSTRTDDATSTRYPLKPPWSLAQSAALRPWVWMT